MYGATINLNIPYCLPTVYILYSVGAYRVLQHSTSLLVCKATEHRVVKIFFKRRHFFNHRDAYWLILLGNNSEIQIARWQQSRLVYHRNHLFGLGPIPKPKLKIWPCSSSRNGHRLWQQQWFLRCTTHTIGEQILEGHFWKVISLEKISLV